MEDGGILAKINNSSLPKLNNAEMNTEIHNLKPSWKRV